jgi:hypothetical protein
MKLITLPGFLQRLIFLLLCTAVMVFFSEKMFWYVAGYPILELILFYALPAAFSLWMIDRFRVGSLSGVVLIGSLFGFLVEGVLTPVIYEAGLLDPVMPAYFVGWHGLLSVVIGIYWIRSALIHKRWKSLLGGGFALGIFWGFWSLPYRLPEAVQEFQGLLAEGEHWIPGAWPFPDFLIFTLAFTGMMTAAHGLLGLGFWQENFRLTWWELGILSGLTGLVFYSQVFVILPQAVFKLLALIGLVVIPLEISRRRNPDRPSLLIQLSGRVGIREFLPLLAVPAGASLVYGLAGLFPPPDHALRGLYELFTLGQILLGAGLFLWAWISSIWSPAETSLGKNSSPADQTPPETDRARSSP